MDAFKNINLSYYTIFSRVRKWDLHRAHPMCNTFLGSLCVAHWVHPVYTVNCIHKSTWTLKFPIEHTDLEKYKLIVEPSLFRNRPAPIAMEDKKNDLEQKAVQQKISNAEMKNEQTIESYIGGDQLCLQFWLW